MVRLLKSALMAVGLTLASCDATIHFYPEADIPVPGKSQIRLDVDWSGYGRTVPTGMTVMCHHTGTGEYVRSIDNNTSYVTPHLTSGRHWATVFNLTEDEFGCIGFRGLDRVDTAEAYALSAKESEWYENNAGDGSYVAEQPEWLAVDTIMTKYVATNSGGGTVTVGTLRPKNIIHTLHLTVSIENVSNLRSARAAISGLASGRRLAAGVPNDNSVTVTHLIESSEWSRSRASSEPDIGIVSAEIRCFGLPGNHIGQAGDNTLELQTLLADGKTVLRHKIPVGHLITPGEHPPELRGDNLDLYLNLALILPPGEKPPSPPDGSWGFDAWIDEWDKEDVPVPFPKTSFM